MLRPRGGYALVDALLACWVLALALSPLLIAQAQAARDARLLHTRARLVLQAAASADRLRQAPSARVAEVLAEESRRLAAETGSRESGARRIDGQTVRLVLRWRDAERHHIEWLVRLP